MGTFTRGRLEMNGDAAHHADEEGCDDDAPETAEAADHDDDEGHRHDLGAHRRVLGRSD